MHVHTSHIFLLLVALEPAIAGKTVPVKVIRLMMLSKISLSIFL